MINIILILVILLFIYLINDRKVEIFVQKKPKIAVYTYNFGNFRNELSHCDNFKKYNDFDYFLYTDQHIRSSKWNV